MFENKFICFLIFSLFIKVLLCEQTIFYYYTRKNLDKYIQIKFDQANSSKNLIDRSKKTAFVVHGFDSNPLKQNFLDIKNGLLKINDMNVILVDWSDGADTGINYIKAVNSVKTVGSQIGEFIEFVNIDPKTVHCIGHSLGAHVCGFAGKYSKLKRISGMDPAGPLFTNVDSSKRLDKSDADFVDAIHTSFGLGIQKSIAHKDFYVNGGEIQPGCLLINDLLFIRCYHLRAIDLYAESITTQCSFKSTPCNSYESYKKGDCKCDPSIGCSSMGYRADLNEQEGDFYLKTNSQKPFCIE